MRKFLIIPLALVFVLGMSTTGAIAQDFTMTWGLGGALPFPLPDPEGGYTFQLENLFRGVDWYKDVYFYLDIGGIPEQGPPPIIGYSWEYGY